MTVVDTHTHAGINWFEPVEMLLHQMTLNEVDHAVLIPVSYTHLTLPTKA